MKHVQHSEVHRISELTRRDLIDAIHVDGLAWWGRLDEPDFLRRLFDLDSLPSDDPRYSDAAGDIWQHRVRNHDWEDDWVFYDRRFGLLHGDDEVFLRFLCETIHPAVRPDASEVEQILALYNRCLRNDGFQLVERARISDRPVFAGRFVGAGPATGVSEARAALADSGVGYVAAQITRMEVALTHGDVDLAIGTAKELVETCCKTILAHRGAAVEGHPKLPRLVRLTVKELALTPADIPDQAKAADTIRVLLSNLATIANGIAELRNSYGTGHGQHASRRGLDIRHAKLAVGAASTLAVFLAETDQLRESQPDRLLPRRATNRSS